MQYARQIDWIVPDVRANATNNLGDTQIVDIISGDNLY